MSKLFPFLLVILTSTFSLAQTGMTFHDFSARDIEGNNIDFSDYHGKKVMVVNTASFCAFTPQFDDLQSLYEQYNQYDFEILGFPCNDFDNQDPGNDSTILEFCTENYGVTFQMMSKIIAVEPDTAPVFRWLQEADLNGVSNASISWNFHKFLIDEAGHWVAHHGSLVNPLASSITDWIMSPSALSVISSGDQTSEPLVRLVSPTGDDRLQLVMSSEIPQQIDIELYTMEGRRIDLIHSGAATTGRTITYDAGTLPMGIYLIRVIGGNTQQVLRYVATR